MAGHFQTRTSFPDDPSFSGFMKPCRFEGEQADLEVIGTVPRELDGTFYRVMPDPQFPPFIENDAWFNGDGSVSAFRFHDGSVHFQQKFVRTEKFIKEREAKRALAGRYRNKFTDLIEFNIRTTANTNIYYFNKVLLAIKEDAPPYMMDPHTLDTIGLCDFDGQLPSLTFTAHPKRDPITKELVSFGYEAKGDGTPDVCYFNISPEGKFTQTVWFVCPVVGMIHDFAVTENWVLFPMIPLTCDLERLQKGGEHWQWDGEVPFYLGVLPRHGAKGSDIKWFRYSNSFPGHVANAYETASGELILDLPLSEKNVFFWWPDAEGNAPQPQEIHASFVRFKFDPRGESLDLPSPAILSGHNMEFPRIDERFLMKEHGHCFFILMDPSLGTDLPAIKDVMGGHAPYNAIGHYNHASQQLDVYFPGRKHFVQEPIFVSRSDQAEEGDGYIIVLVSNFGTMSSELHIVDTRDFTKPLAIVMLNMRLRAGLHGNWVDATELV